MAQDNGGDLIIEDLKNERYHECKNIPKELSQKSNFSILKLLINNVSDHLKMLNLFAVHYYNMDHQIGYYKLVNFFYCLIIFELFVVNSLQTLNFIIQEMKSEINEIMLNFIIVVFLI